MHIGLRVNYPLQFSEFNQKNFLDRISKNHQITIFMKSLPVDFFVDRGHPVVLILELN